MVKKTATKKHTCEICGKPFSKRGYVASHIAREHEPKPIEIAEEPLPVELRIPLKALKARRFVLDGILYRRSHGTSDGRIIAVRLVRTGGTLLPKGTITLASDTLVMEEEHV